MYGCAFLLKRIERHSRAMRAQTDQKITPVSEARRVVVQHDPVNELVVLAAAIVSPEVRAKLVKMIQPDHFLVREHAAIWAGLQELERRKLAYDPATLQQIAGDTVDIKFALQLEELRPEVPENLDFHIQTLMWDRARATAATGPIAALVDAVHNPREAPERVRALARQVGAAFDGHSDRRFLRDPDELVRDQMATIEQRAAGFAVYPFGIHGLDFFDDRHEDGEQKQRLVPGVAPKTITVVTGVSGAGKSTMLGHMILGLARRKRRVAVGAWEMGSGMNLELLACLSLKYSRSRLMTGRLDYDQKVALERTMQGISKYVRFIDNPFRRMGGDKKKASNDRNLDLVQGYLTDCGADVFVADLWERCLVSTDVEEEKQALFRQQAMADDMKMACILAAQQKLKEIEQRTDKRPTRDCIKGSGAWTEVSDTILGFNRPALWKRVDDNVFEALVLKQRYGEWPLQIEFDWEPDTGQIAGGRSVPYDPPGTSGDTEAKDSWVGIPKAPTGKRKGKGRD